MTKEDLALSDAAVARTPSGGHKRIERRRRRSGRRISAVSSSRARSPWFLLLLAVVLMVTRAQAVEGKLQLCEVETGQTNIILDIEESRGSCEYYFDFEYILPTTNNTLKCGTQCDVGCDAMVKRCVRRQRKFDINH